MIRSARHVAGFLALVALTFSFAESVWASTCAMPLMTPAATAAAEEAPTDAPHGMRCGRHENGSAPHGHDGSCPFDSPAASQACAGVASLPSTTAELPPVATDGAPAEFTLDTRIGLLLGGSLFRPPRA